MLYMFDECKASVLTAVLTQRFIYMTWEIRWLSLIMEVEMEGVGVEGGGKPQVCSNSLQSINVL